MPTTTIASNLPRQMDKTSNKGIQIKATQVNKKQKARAQAERKG